ncbi:GH92 family glycosyl hydrolase [Pararcticibacter amylolyticus]|uniref:Glycoside hydrolase family 92 protein n=1 Tax=Pararcticibacter amylolyticus TaxID=2173175 RepID=A0A2U2PIY8_9SPHI|nr:GH92 family glycosyl hydrolase [Pararcticibacter amylolyticus]PWG81234.1 glycoside hydrolase family 92 protein [Pararcticibacter amylolyticus]
MIFFSKPVSPDTKLPLRKILSLILIGSATLAHSQSNKSVDYANVVNTQIGSKGKGHGKHEQYLEAGYTFPGAMSPFGMVQFTTTFFNEDRGFVINQMSGAGCEHMGNMPLIPLDGALKVSPDSMTTFRPGFKILRSVAGYYKSESSQGVVSELGVTTRTGMGRFSFTNNQGTIIIGTGINATKVSEASVKITSSKSFEGYADGGQFCGAPANYKLYFVAEFSEPASAYGTWEGASLRPSVKAAEGENSGVYFTFNTQVKKKVLYKVGVSYVSLENARQNLKSENNAWNFDAVVSKTQAAWNKCLGKIEVSKPAEAVQFYTGLYHVFTHPNIYNDVNGEYIGADYKVHKVSSGNYYTAFSNWDTYRTQVQLIAMLFPRATSDMMNSVITFAEQAGGGFPRWVLNSTETGIMQGDPTSILVANAYAFGANRFDLSKALKIMRRGAEDPETKSQKELTRPMLKQYLEKGYMNASMMLEYTSADFSIGQFALQAFKDSSLYRRYLKRAQYWKNLYNPETTWLRSRNEDGSWKSYNEDWRELSYKGYFWMIPYNWKALIDTIGGKEVAEKRLDGFFSKLNANYHEEWFASGNEPDFQVPWAYNWTGQPYKTQHVVKRIIKEQYSNRPNGLPGNDDLGAMGAFYVFANIGMFPVIPAVGGFSVNSPSFGEIKVHLAKGTLVIKGGNPDKTYINDLQLNGKPLNGTWISWKEIENGGTLTFKLSDVPNKTWGTQTAPPSFDY